MCSCSGSHEHLLNKREERERERGDFKLAEIPAVTIRCCSAIIRHFINWSRTKPAEVRVIAVS